MLSSFVTFLVFVSTLVLAPTSSALSDYSFRKISSIFPDSEMVQQLAEARESIRSSNAANIVMLPAAASRAYEQATGTSLGSVGFVTEILSFTASATPSCTKPFFATFLKTGTCIQVEGPDGTASEANIILSNDNNVIVVNATTYSDTACANPTSGEVSSFPTVCQNFFGINFQGTFSTSVPTSSSIASSFGAGALLRFGIVSIFLSGLYF